MPKTLNARMEEGQRHLADAKHLYAEIGGQLHALSNERFNVEDSYRKLAALGREEAQLRERSIEVLKRERAVFFNKTLVVGAWAGLIGAFAAGMMYQFTGWLWAAFLAVAGSVWATLAAWWSS